MKYPVVTLFLVLAGCSSDGYIRVTEYDAGATVMPMFGELAGCEIRTSEDTPDLPSGTFIYSGERCNVEMILEEAE